MKKAVLFGILVCLGLGMTALIMIPEEVKTPLILQTFSYSRAAKNRFRTGRRRRRSRRFWKRRIPYLSIPRKSQKTVFPG